MDIPDILRAVMTVRGWTQEQLAHELDTTQATVSRLLNGREPRGRVALRLHDLAVESGVLEDAPATGHSVPVMGYIGAGAKISPEYEQVPADGLEQVELPFAVPKTLIALRVAGNSMLPRYDDGDVLLVNRHQAQAIDTLIGRECAVRTDKGHRYLKRLMRGAKARTYNLESVNAPTIEGVRIAWASPIWIVLKAGQIKPLGAALAGRPAPLRLGPKR